MPVALREKSRWWDDCVGYEIYIRSFCDSNGDGIGDLGGIRSKLHHLAWLGVNIVWITPFYKSPQADFGYDVADYCSVDPVYGTLADFEDLLEEAHRLGLRVIADLVPNHTSDQHQWFREALTGRDSPRRDFYHWRDSAADGGPPNNWVSHFGGSAWTLDEESEQYYLHLFLPEQPDLNWANPLVAKEFEFILQFWLERGLDGFRIDVAHGLTKNMAMLDNPQLYPVTEDMSPLEAFAAYEHRYDLDQAETKEIYQAWRAIADRYDALLLGEVYLAGNDPIKVSHYVSGGDGLHKAFYFAPMHSPWDSQSIWETFQPALDAAPVGLSWALGSHDDSRAPTRFGGGELGKARSLAYATLLFNLPGLPFMFQGDELALENVEVALEDRLDPAGTRNRNSKDSRDNVRTPIPWEPSAGLGFTTSTTPWLPIGDWAQDETAHNQRAKIGSWLNRFRDLLATRAAIDSSGEFEWLTTRGDLIVAFRRGGLLCAINVGSESAMLELPHGDWRVRFSTADTANISSGLLELASPEGAMLELVS